MDNEHIRLIANALVALSESKIKPRNPVSVMDSVFALDLISESLRLFRAGYPASPEFLESLREQYFRHKRALRSIIGDENL